jgi:hypothetical protein
MGATSVNNSRLTPICAGPLGLRPGLIFGVSYYQSGAIHAARWALVLASDLSGADDVPGCIGH